VGEVLFVVRCSDGSGVGKRGDLAMAAGRCAGCGYTDSRAKANTHVMTCGQFLELFRTAPSRCLDPVAEQIRFKAEDDTAAARDERRDTRLAARFAELETLTARQSNRWATPTDLLED
jgi:hypothetical protein